MASGATSSPNFITEMKYCRQAPRYRKVQPSVTNLFVEPEHGAGHGDVCKGDPLSHKEGTGVQVLVQHSKELFHILLGLLGGLDSGRKRKKNDCKSYFPVPRCNNRVQSSRKPLFQLRNTELYTCLLNCMIPRVGKTHALAGGMISESAKLTHCSTWAAA